ncbi:EamA family transporter [Candidatus Woesearchaeota archaeon]|nr:EamA family transporter [Candidatus Woesearchaeota archaeon]
MKRGLVFVLFTAVISGCAIFINQFGVKGIDSTVFTFSKNLVVSLLLLAIILGFREFRNLKKLGRKEWLSLIFIGFVGGSIPFILFFKGLQLSTGAVGSFIHKSMFIFVAVLAILFLKERLSVKILVPAVLLLAGNFFLLNLASFEMTLGAFLVFMATLFWSVETVISKKVLESIQPKILAFGRLFFGSLFIMVYMAFTNKLAFIPTLSFAQLSWILISAPFLLLYVITWYTGLKEIKAATAASVLLLGCPITTLLSFIFLGKALTIMQAAGILLIVAGVISMVVLSERKDFGASVRVNYGT